MFTSGSASLALLIWFQYRIWFTIASVDLVAFFLKVTEPSLHGVIASAAIGILLFILLSKFSDSLTYALLPAWILPTLFLWPLNMWSFIIVTAVSITCLMRILVLLPYPKFVFARDRWHISLIVLVILTIIAFASQVWTYDRAWRTQYMFFFDWGMFFEPAMNTLRGELMMDYWEIPGESFFSRHFQPGFFVWFIPLLALFPYPQTMMAVGALFLSGSSLLIYYFARLRKLPPVFAGLCGLIYLLYPLFTNYNLSLFYGFHVIYFFIPVFIVFCCLYEKKMFGAAFAVFLFSLTIKETVGAFWVGWGIIQFITGHRKRGIIYAFIGGIYLICCMKLIIPAFSSGGGYLYQTHYEFLGNSLFEIALSPILRPCEFWGTLFQGKKLMQLFLLLLPFIPLIFSKSQWVACALVIWVFSLLSNHDNRINLHNQYTVELSIMICLAFIASISHYRRKPPDFLIKNLLLKGLPAPGRRHLIWNLTAACLFGAVIAYSFLAETPFNRFSDRIKFIKVANDRTPVREHVIKTVPPRSVLGCDERTGALMIGSNIKLTSLMKSYPCDYYFYDLGAKGIGPGSGFHNDLLKNKNFNVIWTYSTINNFYFLLQRNVDAKYPTPMRTLSEEEWRQAGSPIQLATNQDLFQAKVLIYRNPENRLVMRFSILVGQELDKYYQISTYAANDGDTRYFKTILGYGVTPIDEIKPGTVFQFEVPLPANWNQIQQGGCKLDAMP